MIEIDYEEKDKVDNLYNEIKNIILSKKDNQSYDYNRKQHHLYEESEYPGISKNYYNESGIVKFENINGEIIKLQIYRWHPHKHNGYSGLNGIPCLTAEIYIRKNEKEKLLWKLNVTSGTLYYKAEVSSLEIPKDILQEKPLITNRNIQENQVEEIIEDEVEKIVEPQEKRILFDEIVNLYNKYKSVEQKKEELLLKRQKEIEEATEKIIKSYSHKLTQNNENITSIKKELNDYNTLFAKYSTFNIDLVGNTLQQLISIVESEEYLYKQVTHSLKKEVHDIMDSWDENIQTNATIVVRNDKLKNFYDSSYESEINELVKNGDAILLSEYDINSYNNKKITFYSSQDGKVVCNVDFGRFDYIKEFIDIIVQYRFQNDMVEFTEIDMLSFMKDFVISHKDIIMENYSCRLEKKVLNLRLNVL